MRSGGTAVWMLEEGVCPSRAGVARPLEVGGQSSAACRPMMRPRRAIAQNSAILTGLAHEESGGLPPGPSSPSSTGKTVGLEVPGTFSGSRSLRWRPCGLRPGHDPFHL